MNNEDVCVTVARNYNINYTHPNHVHSVNTGVGVCFHIHGRKIVDVDEVHKPFIVPNNDKNKMTVSACILVGTLINTSQSVALNKD